MNKTYLCIIIVVLLVIPFFEIGAKETSFRAALIPDDTFYFRQWYLKKIKAEDAWERQSSINPAIIAIIDSGVQLDHPDLKKNIWKNTKEIESNGIDDDGNGYVDDLYGWDFVDNDNDPNPDLDEGFVESEVSHGTIIAGIAAALGENDEGVAGLSWNAKIMPLLVLDSRGVGDVRDVISAIDYAVDNGADIINLSFVGEVYSSSLENAIRRAYRAGVLVVAAAGNNNKDEEGRNLSEFPLYPVCMDGSRGENMVLGVAATDALDQKTNFSGYGRDCIDITAPGVSIFSASLYSPKSLNNQQVLDEYYDGYWSGTSMATPMVSGAAAMLISKNPSLTRDELIKILLGSSDYIEKLNPRFMSQLGAGRLNIARAMKMGDDILDKKKTYLISSAKGKRESEVSFFDEGGKLIKTVDVFGDYVGPVNVGASKTKTDDLLVVAAGKGGGPQVQIYNLQGHLLGQFLAYDEKFRGGVKVAIGDLDGDGVVEIVTGAGSGGGPHIRVFNLGGELLAQFFAYDEKFRGGVNITAGDVNGDSVNEIVVAAGPGGGPQVRVFDIRGRLVSQFFAFAESFRGGVNVTTADIDGGLNKQQEIIVAPASKGGPHVRVLTYKGELKSDFFAYDLNYRSGVQIASGDFDNDGLDEIVTGAGEAGTAHVRLFEKSGTLLNGFLAYERDYQGGVNVSSININ